MPFIILKFYLFVRFVEEKSCQKCITANLNDNNSTQSNHITSHTNYTSSLEGRLLESSIFSDKLL
jgi:hypothetical protein